MITIEFTCNCYEPMFRDVIKVTADNFNEAWDKAKQKAARKYRAKIKDITITSTHYIGKE